MIHWSRPRDGLHYLGCWELDRVSAGLSFLKAIGRITHTEARGVFHAHRQTRKPCGVGRPPHSGAEVNLAHRFIP